MFRKCSNVVYEIKTRERFNVFYGLYSCHVTSTVLHTDAYSESNEPIIHRISSHSDIKNIFRFVDFPIDSFGEKKGGRRSN